MATQSFTRPQRDPTRATLAEKNIKFYERIAERQGGLTQKQQENLNKSYTSIDAESQAQQDKEFNEQANISTYAGPAISTPQGQLTFKNEDQRTQYIREYEKALARNPNVIGGYSTPEGPVAYYQQDTPYTRTSVTTTPEGFKPSGAYISPVDPSRPQFSVGERIKSNLLTARQDVADIGFSFTGRAKRDESGRLQP